MNVTLEDACREACLAIGEGVVRERLLSQELAKAQQPEDQAPTGGE